MPHLEHFTRTINHAKSKQHDMGYDMIQDTATWHFLKKLGYNMAIIN